MSTESEEKPVLLSFFDSFLHERNIKWLLGLGMLILLASSVMLVTAHWHAERYTPTWKYLTLLAYAIGIFLASQWTYHRALLRKTGTVLMALSVLLTPVTFLALRWVQPESASSYFGHSMNVVLLGLNLALTAGAAHRIFKHFLRQPQPTFIISFLGLSLAGALVPGSIGAASRCWLPLAPSYCGYSLRRAQLR